MEAVGSGRRVRGAVHAAAEALAQHAGHERQGAGTADKVDAGDVGVGQGLVRADERGHGLEGLPDEAGDGGVVLGHGDDDVVVAELHDDAARLRLELLLGGAGLVEKLLAGAAAEDVVGAAGGGQGQVGEGLVEVVAAEAGDAEGGLDDVLGAVDTHERDVEGAATEVIDDDARPAGRQRAGVPVRVLEGGGGGLVDHTEDVGPGTSESVEGEQTLRGTRVGGHAEDDLDRLPAGVGPQMPDDAVREGREHIPEEAFPAAHRHGGVGGDAARAEQPLEGAGDGRVVDRQGLPPADQAVAVQGDDRGNVLPWVSVGVDDVDHGVVPAVNGRNHSAGGAEINPEAHAPEHYRE